MAPLIEVTDVHKRYGRKPILRGVSLSVSAGEVVALLGSNGAGKSTLLRTIAGLTKADRGAIALGGVTMSRGLHELRRYIGLVSHLPLLYDNLTAWENLLFFGKLYDLVDVEKRAESVLRSIDLWARRNDTVRTYSRGMVQRLAIGRATLHNPPVLLLDEPDTGLDPASAEMLQTLIRSLGAGDRAILLTTHNLERALTWADSVCVLSGGTISGQQPAASLDVAALQQQLVVPSTMPPIIRNPDEHTA
jgi:heme exporter protein A